MFHTVDKCAILHRDLVFCETIGRNVKLTGQNVEKWTEEWKYHTQIIVTTRRVSGTTHKSIKHSLCLFSALITI